MQNETKNTEIKNTALALLCAVTYSALPLGYFYKFVEVAFNDVFNHFLSSVKRKSCFLYSCPSYSVLAVHLRTFLILYKNTKDCYLKHR
jgi:hypothetical protein